MPAEPRVYVAVPCEVKHLDLVHAVTEQVGRFSGMDEQACLDLGLAVREAVVNGMSHGNGLGSPVPVEVAFHLHSGSLEVEVRDRGPGFDPTTVPDPTLPENVCRTTGRGLLLIQSFVDRLRFRSRRGGGMVLVLSKNIASPSVPLGEEEPPSPAAGKGAARS